MMYEYIVGVVASVLSISGAAIVFLGGLAAVVQMIQKEVLKRPLDYNDIRRNFTFKLMMGLEFFIGADLIKSVLEPTPDRIFVLAAIVAIRTVIGYSLSKELKDLEPQ